MFRTKIKIIWANVIICGLITASTQKIDVAPKKTSLNLSAQAMESVEREKKEIEELIENIKRSQRAILHAKAISYYDPTIGYANDINKTREGIKMNIDKLEKYGRDKLKKYGVTDSDIYDLKTEIPVSTYVTKNKPVDSCCVIL